MRAYPIDGLRRVTPDTRGGRPLCDCAQGTTRLYAWTGCSSCRGTGGVGAGEEHVPSEECAEGTLAEGT